MPKQVFSDGLAQSTLAADFGRFDATFTVATGDGGNFQTPQNGNFEAVTITDGSYIEVVPVSNRSDDTFTVYPGLRGSFWGYTDRDWLTGATVYAGIPPHLLDFIGNEGWEPPEWTALTNYLGFPIVKNTAGTRWFVSSVKVTNTNTKTGASEPTWNTTLWAGTNDSGYSWICIYDPTLPSQYKGTAQGFESNVYAENGTSVGDYSSSIYGVSVGMGCFSGHWGAAVGYENRVFSEDGVAVGEYNIISAGGGNGQVAVGGYNTVDGTKTDAIAVGYGNNAGQNYATAMGVSCSSDIPDEWQAGTTYAAFSVVRKIGSNDTYFTQLGGTSGGSAPTWTSTIGDVITDNTVSWVFIGTGSGTAAQSTSYGYRAYALGDNGLSIGVNVSTTSGTAIGLNNHAGAYGVTVGHYIVNNSSDSVLVGHDISSVASPDYGCWSLGGYNVVGGGGDYCGALGFDITNDVPGTYKVSGAPLLANSSASNTSYEHIFLAGTRTVYRSDLINLKNSGDDVATITIPTGATFYPDEFGLIINSADTVTVQPYVSTGITGNTTALLASTQTTGLTAAKKRQRISTALPADGINSLTASIQTGATATALTGQFYWVGLLVEDE